jgi:hypothetical protein
MAPDGSRKIVWMIIGMIKAHRYRIGCQVIHERGTHLARCDRYPERMTVRDMLTALQALPRDAELLAFEAG